MIDDGSSRKDYGVRSFHDMLRCSWVRLFTRQFICPIARSFGSSFISSMNGYFVRWSIVRFYQVVGTMISFIIFRSFLRSSDFVRPFNQNDYFRFDDIVFLSFHDKTCIPYRHMRLVLCIRPLVSFLYFGLARRRRKKSRRRGRISGAK